MMLPKLLGAALLLLAAVAFLLCYRRALLTVQAALAAWEHFLTQLRHDIRVTDMPLSLAVERLDEGRRRLLTGGMNCSDAMRAEDLFALGSRAVGGVGASALLTLYEQIGKAEDGLQVREAIERAAVVLQAEHARCGQETIARVRIAAALSLCGALSGILLLW